MHPRRPQVGPSLLLLFLFEVFVDAAEVFADFAAAKFVDFADEAGEEVAVVANDDERAVEVGEGLLEDVFGAEVEVVGRLVEYQQVDGLKKEFDHAEAHTLAARQDFDFLLVFFAAKHEGAEEVADFQAHVANGNVVDGLKYGQLRGEERGAVLGEVADFYVVAQG